VKPVDYRSYEVPLDSGNILRRNRRHLRKDKATVMEAENRQSDEVHRDRVTGLNSSKDTTVVSITKSGRKVIRPSYLKDYVQ